MQSRLYSIGILVASLTLNPCVVSADADRVTVRFIEPERFTDVSLSGSSTDTIRNHVLKSLEQSLVDLGKSHLADNQSLAIEMLDIDMAGNYEPWRRPLLNNVRFVRDVYRPRIKLRYTWRDAQGTVLASAQESVTDLNYLILPDPSYLNFDPLKYEKTLLRRWFEQRFGGSAP
ncbi:MAG: DUF3016 domain-containing protein [Methylococcaceae bacterium]|nr:DUF3016 domain-containing protein [Methylococcaceae bacterium]